jgi:uncharacterized membrane protein (UPF0127 family)
MANGKAAFAGLAVALVIAAAAIAVQTHAGQKSSQADLNATGTACIRGDCFSVEVSSKPDEIERGLMFRQRLGNGSGMLFIFNRDDNHPFWMKNTLMPLDIIWIDGSGRIVFIAKDVQPCGTGACRLISPGVVSRYVLEINGGLSDIYGFSNGDEVRMTR